MDHPGEPLSGSAAVIVLHFEEKLLPKAFDLRDRLDQGERLNDVDIAFLNQLLGQVHNLQTLAHSEPKIQRFAAGVVSLYHELTRAALINQGGASNDTG
ncbi:hypothetical protein [Neptuniibacter sp. CAU 1671]|uniref:hypothetical protein n=1 Tax=Neptuniibacter sp. CAU 1671 TaxID=3032593 RepID=UPI0023DB0424|nr:hypothetical protein [Neptuniibacter sp. CAU 1671]MDF2181691.1 hypothetical protein [Neptuniibacter sp. CAU 1671]